MHSTEDFWNGVRTEDGRLLVKADAEVTCMARYAEMHAGIPLLRVYEIDEKGDAYWIWKGTHADDFLFDMARDPFLESSPDEAALLLAEAKEAFQEPMKRETAIGRPLLSLLHERTEHASQEPGYVDREMVIRDPAETISRLVEYEKGWDWHEGDMDARTSQIVADVGRSYAALGDALAAAQEDAVRHCESIDVWFHEKYQKWCWYRGLGPCEDVEEWPTIRRDATFRGLRAALEQGASIEEYVGCKDNFEHILTRGIMEELESREAEGRYDREGAAPEAPGLADEEDMER